MEKRWYNWNNFWLYLSTINIILELGEKARFVEQVNKDKVDKIFLLIFVLFFLSYSISLSNSSHYILFYFLSNPKFSKRKTKLNLLIVIIWTDLDYVWITFSSVFNFKRRKKRKDDLRVVDHVSLVMTF